MRCSGLKNQSILYTTCKLGNMHQLNHIIITIRTEYIQTTIQCKMIDVYPVWKNYICCQRDRRKPVRASLKTFNTMVLWWPKSFQGGSQFRPNDAERRQSLGQLRLMGVVFPVWLCNAYAYNFVIWTNNSCHMQGWNETIVHFSMEFFMAKRIIKRRVSIAASIQCRANVRTQISILNLVKSYQIWILITYSFLDDLVWNEILFAKSIEKG